MTNDIGGERRLLTALFDSRAEAEAAERELLSAGFEPRDIDLIPKAAGDLTQAVGEPATHDRFWHALKNLFLPEHDQSIFEEGLRRGGVLVNVVTVGSNYSIAAAILDRDGAVDIETREAQWQQDGWVREAAQDPMDSAAGTRSTSVESLEPEGTKRRFRRYLIGADEI
jgi:hypothetical protein